MSGVLVGLQSLCVTTIAVSYAMVHFTRRAAWLWPMGLAALGITAVALLGYRGGS